MKTGRVTKTRALLVLLLGAAALLGGCGRRGPLELPADAPQHTARANTPDNAFTPSPIPATPAAPNEAVSRPTPSTAALASAPPAPPVNGPRVQPNQGFFLDPLL